MKKLLSRRKAAGESPVGGIARVDKRTKDLLQRLQPGEIAIIDHEDIDRIAAEGLVQRRPRAVINASRSSTGRYPNLGPLLLCTAHVPVIDEAGPEVMRVVEGTRLVVDGHEIWRIRGTDRELVGKGHLLTL